MTSSSISSSLIILVDSLKHHTIFRVIYTYELPSSVLFPNILLTLFSMAMVGDSKASTQNTERAKESIVIPQNE